MTALRTALLLAALAPGGTWAANKRPDADLLEFLGSVDAEGSGWSEYLEGTDLDKVTKPKKPATPVPPPATSPARPPTQPPASPPPAAPPEHAK
jgi:hypothetical protein